MLQAFSLEGAFVQQEAIVETTMEVLILEYDSKYLEQLHTVFFSSIRENARNYYTEEQLTAWAPEEYSKKSWQERIEGIQPFIAVIDDTAVGYADLQPTGYIDHFYVKGGFSGRGIGTLLMTKIIKEAAHRKIPILTSDVSLAAQNFFERFGFTISERKIVMTSSVELENARMTKHSFTKKENQ